MKSLASYLPQSIIHDDLVTRLAYARDASMYRLVPKAVTKPKNVTDVKSLLKFGNETNTIKNGGVQEPLNSLKSNATHGNSLESQEKTTS